MLLSAVSVLVVAQSSSEIPEGLMNNAVQDGKLVPVFEHFVYRLLNLSIREKQTVGCN